MKIVNPAWCKAVRVELAERNMPKSQLAAESNLRSREYASAVINGRVRSDLYAEQISKCLGIDVPYLIDISEADIL